MPFKHKGTTLYIIIKYNCNWSQNQYLYLAKTIPFHSKHIYAMA